MYLDRPANRLQSPSGFLSSEQVPPLSLLHVGASTPGFYGKYFIFFEIFNFMRLLKANFQNFIFFFFYGNTATRSAKIRAQKRTVQTYRSSLNRYSMEDNFHYNSMATYYVTSFRRPLMSINPRDTRSVQAYVSIIAPRQFYSPFYSLSFVKDSLDLKLNVTS